MAEIVNAGSRGSSAAYREAGVDEAGGLLFEPRAFWSIGSVDAQTAAESSDPEAQTLRLDREHFRNGERFPVKLTRLAICPINYHLTSYDTDSPTLDRHFRNCAAAVNFVDLLITPPNRQHFTKQRVSIGANFAMRPTAEPTMRFDAAAPYASGVWGASHMRFDKPLRLPPKAAIELDLGTIETTAFNGGDPDAVRAQAAFYERGGGWNGNVRTPGDPSTLPFFTTGGATPNGLPADGFAPANIGGGVNALFDPAGRVISAGEFVKQDPSRQGSLEFEALSVWLDQLAYDDGIEALAGGAGGLPADASNIRAAPMSTRVATRVRCRNGGTGAYWWRPGCPLALVANEITPALVYDLPNPITLEPGDCLDIQMWGTFGVDVGTYTLYPKYNLGVALTGFAIVNA